MNFVKFKNTFYAEKPEGIFCNNANLNLSCITLKNNLIYLKVLRMFTPQYVKSCVKDLSFLNIL